jgi:hypothetical protein
MKKRSLSAISTMVVCLVAYLASVPMHSLDLEKATAQADLIVVGRVLSVDYEGKTSYELPGGTSVPATRFRALLKVDRVLKGDLKSQNLFFEFLIPEYPVGLQGVDVAQYSIFFFKNDQRGCTFFDPTNPDLPAVPNGELPAGAVLDRVAATVAQVLSSPNATESDHFRALDALGRLRTDFARDLLRQALERSSGGLRLDIAKTLVARGDVVGLAVVEAALLRPDGLPENVVAALAGSLRGMKDPGAISSLSRLTRSSDFRVRLGATVALRQTASSAAIAPLSHLLSDSDSQVLYYAVAGLGEITHQDEWTPAMDEFEQHKARYLEYWRNWAGSNVR